MVSTIETKRKWVNNVNNKIFLGFIKITKRIFKIITKICQNLNVYMVSTIKINRKIKFLLNFQFSVQKITIIS